MGSKVWEDRWNEDDCQENENQQQREENTSSVTIMNFSYIIQFT